MAFLAPFVPALGSAVGGALGGLFGGGPKQAAIQAPTTSAQAGTTFDQSQDALAKQNAFVNALQAQNGIGNQTSVFNQLQGVANGTGPNPAQAMLNNATGNNVAQQAALMAGQRGAGANAGLIARQAAQQGGALQQNAVGQAAALQANQSLNALNSLGGIAGQQVGEQAAANNSLISGTQGEQSNILNAIQGQNQATVGSQGNVNNANAALGAGTQKAIAGGVAGLGTALGLNSTPNVNAGQQIENFSNQDNTAGLQMPTLGQTNNAQPHLATGGEVHAPGPRSFIAKFANGGKVPAMLSPGEIYLSPKKAAQVAKGKASPLSGEKIKGKAKVSGDSEKNDTVRKNLDSGGVVVPRTKAKDAQKAIEFVAAVKARNGQMSRSA